MENSLFFSQIEKTDFNSEFINNIEQYCGTNPREQIYLINSPLGDKYNYEYQDNAVVILSPKHRIIFIDLLGNEDLFEEFYEDFIEDLSSISDKFEYKQHIGRPREWKKNNTILINKNDYQSLEELLSDNILEGKDQRVSELLISLLIGSINDISKIGAEIPESLLDKVKKNILLFDGEQTRFIYKEFTNKTVSIQGLSGTGKTELLLHKLKELYLKDDNSKIYFTCHNIALANNLRERIPSFFNFMKVEKQIEWFTRLWVTHAWGSKNYPNSGFYSYLCDFYNLPFYKFSKFTNYEKIFSQVLDHVNNLNDNDFNYAFDYILIDERQDFPDVFFKLCEKIARNKIYIAGDIFQDIFENTQNTELQVDIVLNRCYRTDPRTLMFAHAIGLGLFENKKLNWFPDNYWNAIGYSIERFENREIHLSREPIRRFENLQLNDFESVIFQNTTYIKDTLKIIKKLKSEHEDLQPDDIAIILLDENKKELYDYIDNLVINIGNEFGWRSNRAYENKKKIDGTVYISNPNNVKGLEFPFVICITAGVKNTYKYRNILYTMLTRSFIQSYLLVTKNDNMLDNLEGLKLINKHRYIKTIEPTPKEQREIERKLLKFNKEVNISYEDFLNSIFDELQIKVECRPLFSTALLSTGIDKFDKQQTIRFIKANKEFYCQ